MSVDGTLLLGVLDRLGADSEPLAAFAAEIRRHYEGLAERIKERESEGSYDRMYM